MRRNSRRCHEAINGAGHALFLVIIPWPTRNRQRKKAAMLHANGGKIPQPLVDGIGLSAKCRTYRPTRGNLRCHISADILNDADEVIHRRVSRRAPAGNHGINHRNRQRPNQSKQPRNPTQLQNGMPSKQTRAEYIEPKCGCNDVATVLDRDE